MTDDRTGDKQCKLLCFTLITLSKHSTKSMHICGYLGSSSSCMLHLENGKWRVLNCTSQIYIILIVLRATNEPSVSIANSLKQKKQKKISIVLILHVASSVLQFYLSKSPRTHKKFTTRLVDIASAPRFP